MVFDDDVVVKSEANSISFKGFLDADTFPAWKYVLIFFVTLFGIGIFVVVLKVIWRMIDHRIPKNDKLMNVQRCADLALVTQVMGNPLAVNGKFAMSETPLLASSSSNAKKGLKEDSVTNPFSNRITAV